MRFKIQIKGNGANKLDDQTQLFLDGLSSENTYSFEKTPDEIRASPSKTIAYAPTPAPVEIEEIAIPVRDKKKIRVRIYRKEASLAPPMMFFHGGGWVFCTLDSHDVLCRKLCHLTGMTTFSVDYRLAPENKFPIGLQDCYDTSFWISKNHDQLNVTDDDLILCGDSAGGNLSTIVALMAKRSAEFKVRSQVLFYPICDASRMNTKSYNDYAVDYFLTKEMMQYMTFHYTASQDQLSDPLVSPLLANDLAGLPKTLIQTAEFDVLRDEAETYAKKLSDLGVDVECVRYQGLVHAYAALTGKIDLARIAVEDAANFIKTFQSNPTSKKSR